MSGSWIFLPFWAACLLLTSCHLTPDLDSEIISVDSALARLNDAQKAICCPDTNQMKGYMNVTRRQLDSLEEKIKGDTIVKSLAIKLADAYTLLENAEQCLRENTRIRERSESAMIRVRNLRSDLEKSIYEKNIAIQHSVQESEQARNLVHQAEILREKTFQMIRQIDSLTHALPSLNDSIR